MRLNDEEGNGASLAGRTWQNTARIARAIGNAAVCRSFMRSVLSIVYRPLETITDRSQKHRPLIDRVGMWWFAGISAPQ